MNKKSGLVLCLSIAIVGIIVVSRMKTYSTKVVTVPSVSSPTTVVIPTKVNVQSSPTFTSSTLGISFSHGDEVFVKETQNKIYVYGKQTSSAEDGQSMELFEKNPQDSLQEAIEKQFLKGIPKDTCYVVQAHYGGGFKGEEDAYPNGYEQAEISYPDNPDPNGWFLENAKNCPAHYSKTNGNQYFLADTAHPDRFAFVAIGQYALPSGHDNQAWQSTIRFIDK